LKHISSLRCRIFVSVFKCSISMTILGNFFTPLRYFNFVMLHWIFIPIFILGHCPSLVCILCLCRWPVSLSVFVLCTSYIRMIVLHNPKQVFISATYTTLSLCFPENKWMTLQISSLNFLTLLLLKFFNPAVGINCEADKNTA